MIHAFSGRIFADFYQFFMHDSDADVAEELPEWQGADEEFNRLGFVGTETLLRVGTRNHLHNHWIDVYHSESTPEFADAERVFVIEFSVPSGSICFQAPSDIEPTLSGNLPAGDYALFVIAYNLGVDDFSLGEERDSPMTDDELRARTDFERYKLVFVSTYDGPFGVVHGQPEL